MLKLLESTGSSSNLTTFVYVIAGSAAFIFLFRAAIGYKGYKTSIFSYIYDNYLIDYFYKLNVFRDPSVSAKLKKKLGYHRLVYANIANKEGKLSAQIVTLIHGKGILSIAYLRNDGKLSGNDSGMWLIHRSENGQDKKYKIENPAIYLREYNSHLHQVVPDRKVASAIALSDDCDFSNVHCSFKVIHFSDLDDLFASSDCGYGLNESEINEIFQKLGGKISR